MEVRLKQLRERPAAMRTRGRTLVLGLEHFIDKIGYQAAEYARRGIDVVYLVLDQSGMSRAKAREYQARVEVVPRPIVRRIFFTIRKFWSERPVFCELYDIGRLTLLYALIARMFRCRLIVILRGGELWRRPNRRVRLFGVRSTLRLSHHIVAKELNILQDLRAFQVPEVKVTFVGNCVPFPKELPGPVNSRDIDILFLNTIKRWRNVDLLVRALPLVFQNRNVGRVVIAGFTHLDGTAYRIEEKTEREVLGLIDSLGLRDRVEVAGFVPNPEEYYRRAKIFVLPADIVFANYSLLEAMSYGVVPVVGDGEGAERIVRSGENGLVVERRPERIAEALTALLNDGERLECYAERARATICSEFSMHSWGDNMEEVRSRTM